MKKIFVAEFYAFDEDLRVYDNHLDAYNDLWNYLDNLYDQYSEDTIKEYKMEFLNSYTNDYLEYVDSFSFGVKGLFSVCEYELRKICD